MSQKISPEVTRLPNCLAISTALDGPIEIQERSLLCGSFGVTLVQTEEGQVEAQICDGEHACTSRSSRRGRSGWVLGVWVGRAGME